MRELQALCLVDGHQLHGAALQAQIDREIDVESLRVAQSAEKGAEGGRAVEVHKIGREIEEGGPRVLLLLSRRCQCALDIEASDTSDPGDQLGHRLTDMASKVADLLGKFGQPREGVRRVAVRIPKVEESIAQGHRLHRIGTRDRLVERIEDVVGVEPVGTPCELGRT